MDTPDRSNESQLSATTVHTTLGTQMSSSEAHRLAERLVSAVGTDALVTGMDPLIDGLTVAWAIKTSVVTSPPLVVSDRGTSFNQPLIRLGETDIYALAVTLPDGTAMQWAYQVQGESHGGGILEVYTPHPDSQSQPDIPTGTLIKQPAWHSTIFAGTVRDWWLYVPAQYEATQDAGVMVFQDGGWYTEFVPTTFDNLIARGDMPVTIGIFLNPGTFADTTVSNRSVEYDTLSDHYTCFLLEEILPTVQQTYHVRQDAASRAIAGISSGGICAFTVAWQRPDQFSKVLSWVGSFTNIAAGPTLREGGHNYPALIRRVPKKPIRVFLQGGDNDLDNMWGNWPLANQEMARALAFAGYDYQFVYGQGFHNNLHGRAILPDALRWLWR